MLIDWSLLPVAFAGGALGAAIGASAAFIFTGIFVLIGVAIAAGGGGKEFIGAVAFARPALGYMLAPGLSLGIALGAAVIVAAWILTWVYVRWANRHYDPVLRALREQLR